MATRTLEASTNDQIGQYAPTFQSMANENTSSGRDLQIIVDSPDELQFTCTPGQQLSLQGTQLGHIVTFRVQYDHAFAYSSAEKGLLISIHDATNPDALKLLHCDGFWRGERQTDPFTKDVQRVHVCIRRIPDSLIATHSSSSCAVSIRDHIAAQRKTLNLLCQYQLPDKIPGVVELRQVAAAKDKASTICAALHAIAPDCRERVMMTELIAEIDNKLTIWAPLVQLLSKLGENASPEARGKRLRQLVAHFDDHGGWDVVAASSETTNVAIGEVMDWGEI